VALINKQISESPFINPQNLISPFAKSIKKKRALLIKELFINTAKASDISYDSLAVALKDILFFKITLKDIYKSILKAGNIAFKINKIFIKVL
jgi:hypothetical protein